MPINSLESAKRYTGELDKLFVQKTATGFFTDNALAAKFVGAKTVLIPDADFQGLVDYDRDTGFTRGAVTVSNTPYTMLMDRARSLQIDREDMDETGIAGLAGKILGEYVRTKVVPECDAYVISKLAGLAATRANLVNGEIDKPYAAFCELVNNVRENVGYDEELVAFVSHGIYTKFENSPEISKFIAVDSFKQGEVDLKVKKINGVTLIPVVSERMKTAYTFNPSGIGGFKPYATARETYMLVCPKNGAHLVKKSETMRIFTPEQNLDADAYKFDYRIYYDVFVKKSGLDAVWAWLSPAITISAQPTDKEVTAGNITGSLSVTAKADSGNVTYQWYKADNENGSHGMKIAGATAASLTIPTDLEAGKHYFFVKIYVDGLASSMSDVATVTVS